MHEGDYHYDEGTSACQNSAQPVPFCPETGGSPERSASPDAKEEQNEAEAPPSHHLRWVRRPNLSAQQRACRHELLLQKDEQGRAPFGLDDFPTDEAKWAEYRRVLKTTYREHRKQQRVAGSRTKDQQRGSARKRRPLLLQRERSPLPRRRGPTT